MSAAVLARRLRVVLGGTPVVDGVDLAVDHGEVVALVGPNGAGKSTLLAALAGDADLAAGDVRIGGRTLGEWRQRDLARSRAVLLQEQQVAFGFTVEEVVEMGRAPWRGHPDDLAGDAVVRRALADADVAHLADRTFASCSGGERSRTSFARVLAQATGVLLLDEPTAALDLGHAETVLGLARRTADAGGAVVVVLHDLSLAAAWADRVVLLDGGRVVADGAPADVLTAERLSAVYGHPVEVLDHPATGDLLVVPAREPRAQRARTSAVALSLLLLLLGVLLTGTGVAVAPPAAAAARVDVANANGDAAADTRFRTELTVTGRGFQAVRGGFGGVYVMFGWVRDPSGGSWRPSRGGLTGRDYRYVPDSEDAAANQGFLQFVAFPGSSTAGEAGTTLADDGSFRVTLTVPGPVFESVDRSGDVVEVDCRAVTCGVITVGAHGVKNAANESFTPVRFGEVLGGSGGAGADPADADQADGGSPGSDTADGDGAGTDDTDDTTDTADGSAGADAPEDEPALTVDRSTAVVGHTLVLTARGLAPGEAVVVVLDDGLAALGPLRAGDSGEVAAALPLPADLPIGTHEVRLTGAASGTELAARFPVSAPDTSDTADTSGTSVSGTPDAEPSAETTDRASLGGPVALAVAAALFLAALAFRLRTARRRPGRVA